MEHLSRGCSLCILHIPSSYYVENELQKAVQSRSSQDSTILHKTRNKDSLNYSVKVLKKKARIASFLKIKKTKNFHGISKISRMIQRLGKKYCYFFRHDNKHL